MANRRPTKSQRQAVVPRVGRPLAVFSRKLTLYQELQYSAWTDLGTAHLRSGNSVLSVAPLNLPGWGSIIQNWDQFRITALHYHFVNDSTLGQTGLNNAGRVITLLTSYDPDGGTESAVDILSRNNLETNVLGFASNTSCHKTCVPGYLTTTGEVLRSAWLDQNAGNRIFYAFQSCVDTLKSGITPSDVLKMGCYLTVSLDLRGAR